MMSKMRTLALVLVVWVHCILSDQMFYPWARSHDRNFHFEERQNDLLNSLRNELRLEVLTEKLPVGMDAEHSVYIRNSEGQQYTCGARIDNKEYETSTASLSTTTATSSNEDKEMSSFQKAFGVIDRLQKVCMINSIDWWSYEWCHRKEVKQFHLAVDSDTKKHVRNPEWSLGTYVYSDYYSHEFDEDTVEEVIDYYEDGQLCAETGEGRKTEVHLRCCSDDAAIRTYRDASGIPPEKILAFQKLRETKTCSYQIDMCTPLLCDEIQHADRPEKLKTLSLLEFMEQFRHVCMQRQENWWSYEVCFGGDQEPGTTDKSKDQESGRQTKTERNKQAVVMEKKQKQKSSKFQGIRQYHVETVMTKTDKENEVQQHQVVQAEFLLGVPPLAMYTNATALSTAIRFPIKTAATMDDVHTSQIRVPSLHLEFTHGEECDIEDVQRGGTVEVSCGDQDGIGDIIEDRTCHYVIKMTSKLMCRVDGFSPPKKQITEIVCTPDGGSDTGDDNQEEDAGADDAGAGQSSSSSGSSASDSGDEGGRVDSNDDTDDDDDE